MEAAKGTEVRSDEIGVESLHFGEEIQNLISPPPEAGSSFTALLELPANQAVKLLHLPEPEESPPELAGPYTFPSDVALIDRVSKFSIFADSPERNSIPSNTDKVKQEPVDMDSRPNLFVSDVMVNDSDRKSNKLFVSDAMVNNSDRKSNKRKERQKKVKEPAKKSKIVVDESAKDGEKLPYVHVRARRGQATDSHSLAERARREKINARMKLLQELVPGCNKITGTAMVLDEIINHVQSLQRQVEVSACLQFLSMRLAAVNPRTDVNLDSLFATDIGSLMDSNLEGMVIPSMCLEGQLIVNRPQDQQQQLFWHFDGLQHQPVWGSEDGNSNFIPSDNNSLLSYDSSASGNSHFQ
ncbi:hypothetical protein LguiA_014458 [Lonicera macranthoides]